MTGSGAMSGAAMGGADLGITVTDDPLEIVARAMR